MSDPAQKHITLILARDLASTLATPVFVVDPDGELVYFNEAAERILGRSYAETQMSAAEWAKAFTPSDDQGRRIPLGELPLARALIERIPDHRAIRIRGADGVERSIEVTAFPLFAQADRLVGGMAVFWEQGAGP